MMRIERGYWDTVPDELEKKRGITFEDALEKEAENYPECKKEAIAKALWVILVGEETLMSKQCIIIIFTYMLQFISFSIWHNFDLWSFDTRG